MITINKRETLPWHAAMTVRDMLTLMKFTFPHIIVTINGKVVHRAVYETTEIPDGADVRVVHLMAGG